ncbi:MAG: hypothetical protein WCX71_03310 [Candidatus Buchananbacteria bacterium]
MNNNNQRHIKAWIISVDMGYGHQRAAFPLKYLAQGGKIISANSYPGIPAKDRRIWQESRRVYEFISRFKKVPFIGGKVFEFYDNLQEIPKFYPRRDLSKPSMQVKTIYNLINKQQWGKHLIDRLAKKPIPLITTFFATAYMAEVFNYPGEIYCLATDTDISRAWAPLHPAVSRIKYFAPNYRVVDRLKLYGISAEKIFLTGFPLPLENIGTERLEILKNDLVNRLANLDPQRDYWKRYQQDVKRFLKIKNLPSQTNHPLTVTFAVGGAGAQKDIAATILTSLSQQILEKKVRMILVAGIHNSVSTFFRQTARQAGLRNELGRGVKIIFASSKEEYFKKFNQALRVTDILWTKPSELSFYCALGVPIVMSPPIGSQEDFNRRWLRTIGSAVSQDDPKYANEWLLDWVNSGWFAEAAMQGFVEAPKFGTYNIEKIISHKFAETKTPKMIMQY